MDELSLGELVAVLTLGQDNSFGQPLESQMRSTLLAVWLAGSADLGAGVRDTAYWCAQLRYLGCTAHAHEVSAMFGDDIAIRGRTLTYDASNPAEVLRDAVAFGRPDKRGVARLGAIPAWSRSSCRPQPGSSTGWTSSTRGMRYWPASPSPAIGSAARTWTAPWRSRLTSST